MNDDFVYSVRMRASIGGAHEDGGRHVSGAERLVEEGEIDDVAAALMKRARSRTEGPDFVKITVDRLPRSTVATASVLPLILTTPSAPKVAQVAASIRLRTAGVSDVAINDAFALLIEGAMPRALDGHVSNCVNDVVPPSVARGATLIDASTGRNLTPDPQRGVRASKFDYHPAHSGSIEQALVDAGLGHFRTREALALATKVIWSGVIAELCWSDDAGYVAGYVATAEGYVRFENFKPNDAVGGRAFFVDTDVDTIVEKLERQPLWITGPLSIDRKQGSSSQ